MHSLPEEHACERDELMTRDHRQGDRLLCGRLHVRIATRSTSPGLILASQGETLADYHAQIPTLVRARLGQRHPRHRG